MSDVIDDDQDQKRKSELTMASSLKIIGMTLSAFLVVIFFVIPLEESFLGKSYILESLSRVTDLSANIPEGDEASAELKEQIATAWNEVANRTVIKPIVSNSSEIKITLLGNSISLSTLASRLRRTLGGSIPTISGSIMPAAPADSRQSMYVISGMRSPQIRLVLRSSENEGAPFFDEIGDYKSLLHEAALQTLAQVDRFAAAGAMSQGTDAERQRALVLVHQGEIIEDQKRHNMIAHMIWGDELDRGRLTEANILFKMREFKRSSNAFVQADAAYRQSHPRERHWSSAYDGLAIVAESQNDFQQARQYIDTALTLAREHNEDTNVIAYHKAEIGSRQAELIYDQQPLNSCNADGLFRESISQYDDIISHDPEFAIAYVKKAELLRAHFEWITTGKAHTCDTQNYDMETIRTYSSIVDDALQASAMVDASNPQIWYNVGKFDEARLAYSKVVSEQIEYSNAAFSAFKKALELSRDDPAIMLSYLQFAGDHIDTISPSEVQQYKERENQLLCRAVKLSQSDNILTAKIHNFISKSSLPAPRCD